MMELTSRLLRPRFCIRYLHILLTFSVFTVFLVFFHQIRIKGPEFMSDVSIFARNANANVRRGEDTTGVLPIVFSHTHSTKKEKCTGDSLMLEGIVPELPVGRARYDNRRLLRIYDFVHLGKKWDSLVSEFDICLATQSSIERIYWIPQVLENWRGPVSLAVYITNETELLILSLYIRFLDRCFPGFMDRVSMHLASPAYTGPFCFDQEKVTEWNVTVGENLEKIVTHNPCSEPKEFMQYLILSFPVTHKSTLALKEVYMQNHMRNIARKSCGTEWTYSTDIDIVPKDGMAESLQAFYESLLPTPCKKCAFVIPTFELDETKPFPKTKKEIVEYYKAGFARQFHKSIFEIGHKATNYHFWTTTYVEEGPVKVSHPIMSSQTYLYEPFYVSPDTIPPFDERFLGYGFTRNSQFQEALYAGWNFTVLTPVYSVHWGLQSSKTLLSPKKDGTGKNVRQEQTFANSKLFNKIIKEMKLKKQEGIF